MNLPLGLAALALVVLPGLGSVLAAFPPRRLPLIAIAGLAFPAGYAVIALASLVLALLHVLTRPVFIGVYAAGTILAWVIALRRNGPRERGAAWREEIAAEPWVHGTWAVLIAAFAVVRATYFPELNLNVQTALRYWADGLEIADAHRVPALSLQWGHLFPSTVSKVVLNSFDGALSLVLGRGPMAPMGALLFAVSVGAALAAFALGRELGMRLTAGLLVLLLFANQVVLVQAWTFDLQFFRAETFGRVVILGGLLLVVRAIRAESFARGRREALLGGALMGVCAGTHLVAFVVGIALAACYVLARFALERRRAALSLGLATGLIAVVIGAVVVGAPGGDLGFKGTTDTATYASISADLGLPKGFDATFFLAKGSTEKPTGEVGSFGMSPKEITRELLVRVTDQQRLSRWAALLVFAVGLACVALVLLSRRPRPEGRGDRVAAPRPGPARGRRPVRVAIRHLRALALRAAAPVRLRRDPNGGRPRRGDRDVLRDCSAESRRAPAGPGWSPAAASLVTIVAAAVLLPEGPGSDRGTPAAHRGARAPGLDPAATSRAPDGSWPTGGPSRRSRR